MTNLNLRQRENMHARQVAMSGIQTDSQTRWLCCAFVGLCAICFCYGGGGGPEQINKKFKKSLGLLFRAVALVNKKKKKAVFK